MSQKDLHSLYTQLWQDAVAHFQAKQFTLDPFLPNKAPDTRRGLSLICRPTIAIREAIKAFLDQTSLIAPDQYYYNIEELHTTVLTLLSCAPDFQLASIDHLQYIQLLKRALKKQSSFEISYRGISSSSSAVMIQGFPQGSGLEQLRDAVRAEFKQSGLSHTIDKRYKLVTAHCSCIRFMQVMDSSESWINFLSQHRDTSFGHSHITEVELVYTDWYFSQEHVQILHRFSLDLDKNATTI